MISTRIASGSKGAYVLQYVGICQGQLQFQQRVLPYLVHSGECNLGISSPPNPPTHTPCW